MNGMYEPSRRKRAERGRGERGEERGASNVAYMYTVYIPLIK